ncbi:histone H1-like [Vanessa cardui]|uniref:histone H1-like n=1 Tax=Vanessa cardui TaxID=171605 RepID=UPI001F140007|nr:histone H1-like [Vanessa cardui]XP_046976381.1 histone H1-like [Vanessa cardui]
MDKLGACIASNLAAIQKVTDSSRKMEGSLVCDLREATRNTQAAVAELLRRQSKGADVEKLERENSQLPAELATFTQRLEQLTAQFNAFQAKQGFVPSAPSSDVATPKRATPAATTATASAARAPVASRKRAPAAQAGRASAGAAATSRASVASRAPAQLTSSEAGLMEHIGALIEEKLAAFRAELFPDRAYREAEKQRGRKRKAGPAPPPVTDLPPVPASFPSSSRPTASAESWATVAARKAQPGSRLKASSQPAAIKPAVKKAPKRRLPKVPATAAVVITVVESDDDLF